MPKPLGRRTFLKKSLGAVGAVLAVNSFEERVLAAEPKATPTPAATPDVAPLTLPMGKIKHLEVSRVICGGNLIGGWAHSRDLIYVSPLVKAYHTDLKIFETFRLAERRGINTVLTNPSSDRVIRDYWFHEGGKIQWISDCASGDTRESIRRSVDAGAHAVYLQGGRCDQLVRDGKLGEVEAILAFMKRQPVPCGLGAHSLETIQRCVAAGLIPDFWVKTLHQDNYWSATPAANRAAFDEVNGNKPDHGKPHDNMWCNNPQETIAFMAGLKQPWIAFKVPAAGAIHPRKAFQWAFASGADFLCVGMFDFQVVENTTLAAEALAAVPPNRHPRAWMA